MNTQGDHVSRLLAENRRLRASLSFLAAAYALLSLAATLRWLAGH